MRKRVWIYPLLLVLLLSIGGCSSAKNQQQPEPSAAKKETVTVDVGALRGATAMGMIKMIAEKPSLGQGVEARYAIEQSPDVLSSKLLSGEMELASIPTNMAANLYNKGVPYQLAAMNTWGVMYVVSNGAAVDKWADLKGQSIRAVSRGASSDVVFRYLLSQNGIDPDKDVNLSYSPAPVELAQLVMAGKTSLACLPEPWVSVVLSKNPQAKVVLDLQQEWIRILGNDMPFAQTCLVVNRDFAARHPEVVQTFLKEYSHSINWVNKNPAAAADLIKENDIGIPAEVAQSAIPRCNLRYMSSRQARPAVEKYLQVLMEFSPETIGGKMPDGNFFY
ncbi:ABC-type uncharacterised transport system, substrate-binding component, TM0202 type [Syntrophomonas zehnderi OL-4]|uniref:ABC-type uncharacterized transport system, substrate-binding component, TM0202 type n=1 Tax=Syntrophomonas zehnderi OL-4 TaxID=690567 RepID=A0A0E4GAL7_9FIRM|nr:ABC transporter substrate-binding protein [Syntrophomonas zehnderi]CFX53072.1 ABC-type uncharacterised transport system, substrate-binding component, TM0202 type [Syntrophomonas zehnderi OL-4]